MAALRAFVAVDVETTGLDFETESVVELAAVRFENGVAGDTFQALLPPGKALTAMARLLTGFGEEELRAAPPAAGSLRAFLDFTGDLPLVAHNADFDSTFIRRALEREKLPLPAGPWLDSLLMARAAWPEWENHKLEFLATKLQLPSEHSHRALPDARRAGLVFLSAQKFLAASSAGLLRDLSALAADLPGWNRVFVVPEHPAPSVDSGVGGGETLILASPLPTTEIPRADETEAAETANILGAGEWLALETAPGADEGRLALQTARRLAARGKRVLIAAPDVAAWDALRRLATASGMTGSEFAALLDPQAYVCARRLRMVVGSAGTSLSPTERAAAIPLAAWADKTRTGLITECRGFGRERTRLLWSKSRCDAYADDPLARAARDQASGCEIAFTTHAALCLHLKLEGALLPLFDSVILLSAHRFQEPMQRSFGREVSFFRLRQVLQALRFSPDEPFGLWAGLESELRAAPGFDLEEWDRWKELWFEPERQFQRFLNKLGRSAKKGDSKEARLRYSEPLSLAHGADPEPVLAALRENGEFLDRCRVALPESAVSAGLKDEIARIQSGLKDFRLDFEWLCQAKGDEVFSLEDYGNPHKAALRSIPLGGACGEKFQALFESAAFISPALAVDRGEGSTEFSLRSLGLHLENLEPRIRVRLPPPLSPMPKMLLAPTLPIAATVDSAAAFARLLWDAAFPFIRDGVFVLIPWPGTLRAMQKALSALVPADVPFWSQHVDGQREALCRLYASRSGGLLLATEGVEGLQDRDGKAPALFVVARMPQPLFHDPLLEAQSERQSSGSPGNKTLWQQAGILRLKREYAALSRIESPKLVWLLDSKACREGLGGVASRSLGFEAVTAGNSDALRAETEKILHGHGQ